MSRRKILVVNDLHRSFIELLGETLFEVDYKPQISKEEVHAIIDQYHGLIVRSKIKIDTDLVEKATNLEFIGRAGAGIDNIDETALRGANIKVFNAPEGNRGAVGEHAIGMILNLFNHLATANNQVINKVWKREDNRGIELGSKVVGIFGLGNTGQSLANKLQGFDCEVIAYDKYHSDRIGSHAKIVSLKEFYALTDVISLHIPLTPETINLLDQRFFESFSKDIFVINTSRGQILSLESLLQMLQSGKVLGAALDVLENENFSTYSDHETEIFNGLVNTGKVIFTPHVAGWTHESYEKISQVLAKKIMYHYQQSIKVV